MGKKNRRNRQQSIRQPATAAEAPPLSPEEQAARRAQQKREWAEQKRGKDRAAGGSIAPFVWAGSGIAAVVVAVVVGIVLFAGGGGSTSSTATPGPSADPRLGGASAAESFNVSATDDGVDINPRFAPNTLTAKAGEVFQINVKNDGHSAHNLVVAALSGSFDPPGSWTTTDPNNSNNPQAILAGDTGTVAVKIDTPGTYQFRCSFHPTQQVGTLTIVPGPSVTASPSGSASASSTPTATPPASAAPAS